ncbi:hypothetical protein QQP08_000699, partial [Theobroma cacao]
RHNYGSGQESRENDSGKGSENNSAQQRSTHVTSRIIRAGPSAGDPAGVSVGGAGGEAASGDGASDAGAGLGDTDGVGEGEEFGSGAGAGDGDLPNNSEGSKTLSTVKMTTGGESKTASATLDEPTPV